MSNRVLPAVVSGLLIIAAALFAIGVAIERHDRQSERSTGSRAMAPAVLLLADADKGHEPTTESQPATTSTAAGTHEPSGRSGGETGTETSGESGAESPAQRSREHGTEGGHESAAQLAREHGRERIFGINPDSTALVVIAIAVSLALAAAVWLAPGIPTALTIIAFGLGAAVFDIREIAHQLDESHTNLVVIASLVALLHLAAAALAVVLVRNQRAQRGRRQSEAVSPA